MLIRLHTSFPSKLGLTLMTSFDWSFFEMFTFWSLNKVEFYLGNVSWNSLVVHMIISLMNDIDSISPKWNTFPRSQIIHIFTFQIHWMDWDSRVPKHQIVWTHVSQTFEFHSDVELCSPSYVKCQIIWRTFSQPTLAFHDLDTIL